MDRRKRGGSEPNTDVATPATMRAYLGRAELTVGELLTLAPGDIIRLNKLVNRDFILQVEGRNKFAGKLGQLRGNRAMQITRHASPDELL